MAHGNNAGPHAFEIGDTSALPEHTGGGQAVQVKQPTTLSFLPYPAALATPRFLESDFAKLGRPAELHLAFQALHALLDDNLSRPLPAPADVVKRALAIHGVVSGTQAPSSEVLARVARVAAQATRSIGPVCAIVGGIVAQEVLKAATGKFTPIQQFWYFDAEEAVPPAVDDADCRPVSSFCG